METKLPQREIEIAARVRQVRQQAGYSQPGFAKELGISRVRLASYEYARAPLRYEVGADLCSLFDINQRWLAGGKKPVFYEVHFQDEVDIPPRTLFSRAYDIYLKTLVETHLKEVAQTLGCKEEAIDPLLARFTHILEPNSMDSEVVYADIKRMVSAMLNRMPQTLLGAYYRALTLSNSRFWKAHRAKLERNHPIDALVDMLAEMHKLEKLSKNG